MFAFTKFLGYLLMPLGLLWLGLGVSAWRGWRRSRPLGLGLALLALLVGFAGNVQVGHALMARLERGAGAVEPVESLDVVCVLGGGTDLDDRGGPQLSAHGDRLVTAARLWHAGKARRLVASGIVGNRDLGAESRVVWRALGIPDAAIGTVAEPCLNTSAEVAAYRRMASAQGWRRVGLLTSAWHLPRAMALAGREGFQAVPLRSDVQGRPVPFQLWHLVPQEEGLRNTQAALWEWLGRVVGR